MKEESDRNKRNNSHVDAVRNNSHVDAVRNNIHVDAVRALCFCRVLSCNLFLYWTTNPL